MEEGGAEGIPALADHPVMFNQVRRIFRNCGIIDPENFNHYLARNGYRGFLHALEIGPEKTLDEVRKSGLRGRGGGDSHVQEMGVLQEHTRRETFSHL